jgi:hypothetical protein
MPGKLMTGYSTTLAIKLSPETADLLVPSVGIEPTSLSQTSHLSNATAPKTRRFPDSTSILQTRP